MSPRYRYFIAYTYTLGKRTINANNEFHTKAPISTLTHVQMIEAYLVNAGAKHAKVSNFIFFSEFEVEDKVEEAITTTEEIEPEKVDE